MAILTGTSKSRFPQFDDPNIGAGVLIGRGQRASIDFLTQMNRIIENNYVEDGVQNIPGFTTVERSFSKIKKPSKRRILTQRPQATVFIKKRMFSTLRSNYDIKFMNEKEKVFLRASKRLFERKTEELAFYESLSNIESIFDNRGFLKVDDISDGILDSILNLVENSFVGVNIITGGRLGVLEAIKSNPTLQGIPGLSHFANLLGQLIDLREINQRSKGNEFTTWISDPSNPDTVGIGSGVGVIELNQVANFNTRVSLEAGGQGGASLEIQDPYRIMVITADDIEIALREAIAEKDSPKIQISDFSRDLLERARLLDIDLNERRRDRGVSEVNFEFILSSETVVGTVVQTAEEFDKFSISNISVNQRFEGAEITIALEIIQLLIGWHSIQKRFLANFQVINEEFSSVRQRLRNEFVGHSIIQQMDLVHVFMNSNTRDDTAQENLPVNLTDLLTLGAGFQGDGLDVNAIKAEQEELAPHIPNFLYATMRERSAFRSDGVQTFSGLVTTVDTSYSAASGSFTISVSCKDNSEFMQISKVNINPSLSQPKTMLEDPLTPFELDIDPGTGLVKTEPELSTENLQRLRYLRFDDGMQVGEKPTSRNMWQNTAVGGRVKTFQHFPGLIYKWKQGILTETLNVNTRKPINGTGATIADVVETYGVTVLDNPFSGLDAADVVSILVSGRPHNYSTFLKHTLDIGTFSTDNTNQSKFYFNFLFDFLERQDHIHGDFIPAVPSPIDPQVASEAFKLTKTLRGLNQQLQRKERELAGLEDKMQRETPVVGGNLRKGGLQTSIKILKEQIATAKTGNIDGENVGADNLKRASLGTAGNDVYVSFDETEFPEIKRKLKYRLKKKPEDVRYNKDQNFLVISEQYDADTDIQAFARNLRDRGPDLFNSQFESPWDQCENAAKSVGFEFFADSQGNLVFRPPQYNRTPLSLLLKVIALEKSEGVSYAPKFLSSLFDTRENALIREITLVELQIFENLLLLGQVSAPGIVLSIDGETTSDGNKIWTIDKATLEQELNLREVFTIEEQQGLRNNKQTSGLFIDDLATELITVRNSILELKGQDFQRKDFRDQKILAEAAKEISNQTLPGEDTSGSENASVNRLNITNKIADFISRRQLLGRALAGLQKNFKEFQVQGGEFTPSNLFTPSSITSQLSGDNASLPVFPKYMEDLIENDLTNEDGWRSGKRFIIEDDVIISMSLSARTPDFNRVEVIGNQDFLDTKEGGLGSIPLVFWAGAVDYDSWRQFGYKAAQTFYRADFTDAESQCAPYAIFKLQEQRKKIHSGSITVMGNEFYQAGDVIYLNNRSMLYYVTAVSHDFDFNTGVFQTQLDLSFGRALGEYIPTTLDVIGKGILANDRKQIGNIKAVRSNVPSDYTFYLETIFFNSWNSLTTDNAGDAEVQFKSSKRAQELVRNVIGKAEGQIRKNQGIARIEVRTFWFNDLLKDDESKLTLDRAKLIGKWVKELLIQQESIQADILEKRFDSSNVVQIVPIDLNPDEQKLGEKEKKLRRFPSSQAWAGLSPFAANDGVELPLNAIDIFFVAERSRFGDQPAIKLDDSDIVKGSSTPLLPPQTRAARRRVTA
jgi:hypothetical protein